MLTMRSSRAYKLGDALLHMRECSTSSYEEGEAISALIDRMRTAQRLQTLLLLRRTHARLRYQGICLLRLGACLLYHAPRPPLLRDCCGGGEAVRFLVSVAVHTLQLHKGADGDGGDGGPD